VYVVVGGGAGVSVGVGVGVCVGVCVCEPVMSFEYFVLDEAGVLCVCAYMCV